MNRQSKLTVRRSGRISFRSGNALIETFLGFQLLMWLSMGMVEFGQYLYMKHAFEGAARDGARVAILPSATQAQVITAVGNALSQANVTFNSTTNTSWLTITDLETSATVTDVSTVPQGDRLKVSLSTTYNQIPNVVRPLYTITGGNCGIKNGKPMTGLCTMVRE